MLFVYDVILLLFFVANTTILVSPAQYNEM